MKLPSNRLPVVIALGVIVFVGVILYANRQSDQRISDIQASRIASCQFTYGAFLEVFEPFFPPPEKRTAEQKKNWRTLEDVVQRRTGRCVQIVKESGLR
jgi:hypothetical protein